MDLIIVLLGLFVGFLVGLTGVGGAALLTPVLILLHVNPIVAVGTDLAYNAVTKLFGTIQHMRQKTVNLKLVRYLASGSIPGAVISVVMLQKFDSFSQHQDEMIKRALGIMLVIIALVTIYRQFYSPANQTNQWQLRPDEDKKRLTIFIGFILGFVVGLTSVGSGSLFALALIYFYRMRGADVVGTDLAHAFLLVTVAGLMHAGFGNVDYGLTVHLLIGSIPGVLIGSSLALKVPTKPLRTMVASFILISGVLLL